VAFKGGHERLDWVARESLRLRPPFTQVWRRCATAAVLGGYPLPAGSLVVIPISALHRHPDLFERPEAFWPERHQHGPARGWLPFGGGARACLGATTARQMIVAALGAALEDGLIEPASRRPERAVLRGGTVEPARGGRIVLRRATAQA
jgi:cytochrome P450